jgi:O-antigen/teichoic acid export membrane protein
MLVGQTAINFTANVFSAAFGLLNVIVFTRLFAPEQYGVYVLGFGFATAASTFMNSWLRLPIMREQARGDGTDVRGIILPGFFLAALLAPVGYLVATWSGLEGLEGGAAVGLALSLGFFEISQEILRSRLQAFTLLKATMIRAVLVPVLGIAFTLVGTSGVLLITSSALAYLIAALALTRHTWSGTLLKFDRVRLWSFAKSGLPLTVSMTLLALSSVIDRFIIAYVSGTGHTGQYTAGVDLVRQALIIPAVSASAAFVPLAVQILANRGREAVRAHLEECLEFLLAIVLPACLGLAVVAPHVANVVLGPDFRSVAAEVMPIVSIAVIFQILSYQYLHTSFLLSNRNTFYLLNTGSVLALNVVVSYLLIVSFGPIGAAWGRLASEVFGFASALVLTRWAFPVPLPLRPLARVLTAAIVMAVVVRGVDRMLAVPDQKALAVLIPIGIASYVLMCWVLDVAKARARLVQGLLMMRKFRVQ